MTYSLSDRRHCSLALFAVVLMFSCIGQAKADGAVDRQIETEIAEGKYKVDVAKIRADEANELERIKKIDTKILSRSQINSIFEQYNERYATRLARLAVAFRDEKQRIISGNKKDEKSPSWDAAVLNEDNSPIVPGGHTAAYLEQQRILQERKDARNATASPPNVLELGLGVAVGIAGMTIADRMKENEAYKTMNSEQRAQVDQRRSAERRQLDNYNEQQRISNEYERKRIEDEKYYYRK